MLELLSKEWLDGLPSSCLCSLARVLEEKEDWATRDLRGVKGMLADGSQTTMISCQGWRLSKSIKRRPLVLWSKMSSALTSMPWVDLTISCLARSNDVFFVSIQNFEGVPSIREPSLL
jgi:hypothetical protein